MTLGFDVGRYTAAEARQMYVERLRQDWQHTSFQVAALLEVNRDPKKGSKVLPDSLNPMEQGSTNSKVVKKGIPLNTPEGFAALQQVSQSWRKTVGK
jgi:hypothetical protein